MRHPIYLITAAVCLCSTYSCRKYLTEPLPIHRHGDKNLFINLIYPNTDTTDFGSSFELIISEPGGKILLDTIAPYNVPLVAKVKTTKPQVDVSTIMYAPTFDYYSMTIYKSVQPSGWTVVPNNPIPLSYPTGTPGTITYLNPPLVDWNSVHFASLPTTSIVESAISSYSSSQLNISYSGFSGNNVAYVIFPTLGQYSYQPIHEVNDTLSLASRDTTVKVWYEMPHQYTMSFTYMTGYLDTMDFSKTLSLYSYWQSVPLGDLQYPPASRVPVQKYSTGVYAGTVNNEFVGYRTFGSAGPTGHLALPFPTVPIYTLNSTANDSFSVSFSQRPTTYTTNWAAGNIYVSIVANPDSMQLHALSLVTSLHSKLLMGHSLTSLSLQNFAYETVPGLDYNGYYLNQTDPVKMVKDQFASDLEYILYLH